MIERLLMPIYGEPDRTVLAAEALHTIIVHREEVVDLALITSFLPFEAGRLRVALRTTFDLRGTHPLPPTFPLPPPDWRVASARMAVEVDLADAVSDDARWNPVLPRW